MDFFLFFDLGFFFSVTAFGLRPSGSGVDGLFLFFNLRLLFPCYLVHFYGIYGASSWNGRLQESPAAFPFFLLLVQL